ncbi:MAG: phosphoribosylformylglycinamidine synthase subunit PurQ [Clostridia bacterium]|nr:phosphoribosylformylglycinamidine synthase subunit PurQ [Clostridia bacterium]
MVYRVYVEKKEGFDSEAKELLSQVREILGLNCVENIRVLSRYDVEEIEEEIFNRAVETVFAEPQTETALEGAAGLENARVFAVEYLPGRFDQRADFAAQCIQLMAGGSRPVIRTAKLYAVYGNVTEREISAIKNHVMGPAQYCEASLAIPVTLQTEYPAPSETEMLGGFLDLDAKGLSAFTKKYALGFSGDDAKFCQDYFKSEHRDPTLTEMRVIDAYWSEHGRHATLFTADLKFEDKLLEEAYGEYLSARKETRKADGVKIKIEIDGNEEDRRLSLSKHGAVISPAQSVRSDAPAAGDKIVLVGAEVQKGNTIEKRKLERLLRNKDAMQLIKRCNAASEGGAAVAVGSLADGLEIDLNAIGPSINEPQERMAVVVDADKADELIYLAGKENLETRVVGTVTAPGRLVMNKNGKTIVDISREFLNAGGARRHIGIASAVLKEYRKTNFYSFSEECVKVAEDVNELSEQPHEACGAETVLMPLGGTYQLTPPQAAVRLVSAGHTDVVTYTARGSNPYVMEKNPYHGGYLAVVESVSKLIATGASFKDVYLSTQGNFSKSNGDPVRAGQAIAAQLGAFTAQTELGITTIGGDFLSEEVFVSLAVTTGKVREVVSPEFKAAGHKVVLLEPEYDENGLPVAKSLIQNFNTVTNLLRLKEAAAVYTPVRGGVAEGVLKMCLGGRIGFRFASFVPLERIFGYRYGSFIIELNEDIEVGTMLGVTSEREFISYGMEDLPLAALAKRCSKMQNEPAPLKKAETVSYNYSGSAMCTMKCVRPKVLIPVFPGTNCEYDAAKAFTDAGAKAELFVIQSRTQEEVLRSVEKFAAHIKDSQIVFLPDGFSGEDLGGSGKFINLFFRREEIKEQVHALLDERDGLMGGIGGGFRALLKLGLVPYGKITDTEETPALVYHGIARPRIVNVRVASVKSPWLAGVKVGDIISMPVFHGEGKFVASDELVKKLAESGQIMTQYVDLDGKATMDLRFNPSGSLGAVEGILSPDGRVFGKTGHSERKGYGLYKNVPGEYDMKLFESAVRYFK